MGWVILRPEVKLPSSEQYKSFPDNTESPYNDTFLALSVTYTCMPELRRRGIACFSTRRRFDRS